MLRLLQTKNKQRGRPIRPVNQLSATVRGWLGLDAKGPKAAATRPPLAAAGRGPDRPAGHTEVTERIDAVLAERGVVSTGRVQLIGLDRVKGHFGDSWERLKDKAVKMAESIIKRHLGPTDMFSRSDDFRYLILFGGLTIDEAEIKCRMIAAEIERRLIGDQLAARGVATQSAVVQVDHNFRTDNADLLEALERFISREIERRIAVVSAGQSRAQDADAAAAAWPLRAEIAKKQQDAVAAIERVEDAVDMADVRIVYRPVWHVLRNALLSYGYVPVLEHAPDEMRMGYDVLGASPSQSLIVEFDLLVLRQLIKDLHCLQSSGRRLGLVACVHFETLATTKMWQVYANLCGSIPEALRNLITFELVGTPDDVPQLRLQQLVPSLRTFSRAVSVRTDLGRHNFTNFRDSGIQTVGIGLPNRVLAEASVIEMMDAFAQRAEKAGLPCFVHGVHTTSLSTAAICAGFGYLDGDAIHPVMRTIDNAFRFEAEDLFAGLRRAD